MILYLELDAGNRRGGEIYHNHLYRFLSGRYGESRVVGREPFPEKLTGAWRHLLYNRRSVTRVRPQLVVVDIGSAARSWAAVLRAKHLGAKLLVVVQGERRLVIEDRPFRLRIVEWCERFLLRQASIILVNSRHTGSLAESRGARPDRIVIAAPGLECERLAMIPSQPLEPPLRLLFVGAYSRVKGLIYLIEAIVRLSDVDVVLDVVGERTREDKYYERITELVETNDLSQNIRLHDFHDRNTLDEFYRRAHILVSPSLFEGYGMVVAEAFCYGLPVIASNAGALGELVVHEKNGLLVPPADAAALADSIRRLSNDRSLRDRMSETNFEISKTLADWNNFEATLERDLVPLINPVLTSGPDQTSPL